MHVWLTLAGADLEGGGGGGGGGRGGQVSAKNWSYPTIQITIPTTTHEQTNERFCQVC